MNHPSLSLFPSLSPLSVVTPIHQSTVTSPGRHATTSFNDTAAEIRPLEFLFCPISSQLVPPPSPASKVLIVISYLRSRPRVRDLTIRGDPVTASEEIQISSTHVLSPRPWRGDQLRHPLCDLPSVPDIVSLHEIA
ncbi:hypothetical protein TIFTF001_003228 [Ficus carica]|uniref:Uncharacterized protein n=1 Tax=Ficus carica TaxID=3494 RepID=A0AA87ZE63_FICCA|nr:hypothetical protein TIFTF001_003228 [Ficus carica]